MAEYTIANKKYRRIYNTKPELSNIEAEYENIQDIPDNIRSRTYRRKDLIDGIYRGNTKLDLYVGPAKITTLPALPKLNIYSDDRKELNPLWIKLKEYYELPRSITRKLTYSYYSLEEIKEYYHKEDLDKIGWGLGVPESLTRLAKAIIILKANEKLIPELKDILG